MNKNVKEVESILNQYKCYMDLANADLTYNAAVLYGSLEITKLLIESGGYVADAYMGYDYSDKPRSISGDAREVGNHEIANYLESVQSNRYKRLLKDANRQDKCNIFTLGMFFDKNSILNQEIYQKAVAETTNMTRCILKNV